MQKKQLSPDALSRLVTLRRSGYHWTDIERETGVKRRIAKRIYEEWVADQKARKKERVRFRFAAEAFHRHIEDIIAIANALVNHLGDLSTPDQAPNADSYVSVLWKKPLIQDIEYYLNMEDMVLDKLTGRDSQVRLNKMIFNSLRVHTEEKIRWQALEEWKESWNSSREMFDNLSSEVFREINRALIEQRNTGIVKGFNELVMVQAVVRTIWDSIVGNKLDMEKPRLEISREIRGNEEEMSTGKYLDESAIQMCNSATESVLKDKHVSGLINQLYAEVIKRKELVEYFTDTLSRRRLYPILLFTKCDLCPV